MNKFFTTFSKTVFLNNYPEQKEIKKQTKSHNKTHSVHYKISEKFLEGKKDSFFSNCKENSFNNSNFQSKRENRNI